MKKQTDLSCNNYLATLNRFLSTMVVAAAVIICISMPVSAASLLELADKTSEAGRAIISTILFLVASVIAASLFAKRLTFGAIMTLLGGTVLAAIIKYGDSLVTMGEETVKQLLGNI